MADQINSLEELGEAVDGAEGVCEVAKASLVDAVHLIEHDQVRGLDLLNEKLHDARSRNRISSAPSHNRSSQRVLVDLVGILGAEVYPLIHLIRRRVKLEEIGLIHHSHHRFQS